MIDYHEETMVWFIIMKINKNIMVLLIIMKKHNDMIIMKKYNGVADYHEETLPSLVWLIIIKYSSLTTVDYHDGMIDYHET